MLWRNKIERYCIVCRERIEECMGFVLAQDFIAFMKGKRKDLREICERDVLKLTYQVSEGVLVERSMDEVRIDFERYVAATQ